MEIKFKITIEMYKEDVDWLHHVYGPEWINRLEQHIHHEVTLRRQDEEGLKMRKPWDY
jgi:hypothetical protein